MNNKTCGECKYWYAESVGKCRIFKHFNIPADRRFCSEFEQWEKPKPTNGDAIRQMSNEELAVMFRNEIDQCPPGECHDDGCIECWLAWLNAPAESEGGNV
jgi:hypothetical protein